MKNKETSKLLIVDSMALLFRGFFATSQFGSIMQTKDGLYTNALYQYTKYLMDAIKTFSPSHIVCAIDMGKETFRNGLYPAYKANRGEPPMELVPQFDVLQELIAAFDIPVIGVPGYEADDVIGTLAKKYASDDVHVYILTGDGDTLQLLDRYISVIMMKKGFGNYQTIKLEDLPTVKGVESPEQIIELKGLMGDSSDNIPGCPSVGPKTALKLLGSHKTIDGVYDNINEVAGKLKQTLLEYKHQVYLSRQLATINLSVPVECNLEECKYQFNVQKIHSMFDKLEFQSLKKLFA
ncbi:5'-3' exonuclease [Ammoniphilus resinae]|uniref:5'-3' exonuclease n=1 Tax=Ammoniphilus resinae TaxID=861532 RepID=A0ABS4GK52_9BACL|nr:5'-3' exonuclease H3TH domain-containing protein [Ammoniphilus resinae]MBP1930643.1 5'-3' exonuclease [Ammoniphilus resinae]